jgi:hypothetical protein
MLHLATSALAFQAGGLRMHAPRAVISPQMSLVDSLKESVVPANQDKTLRNAVGYQALAWGIAGIAAPAFVQSKFLGVTATATTNTLVRGLGWSNLALAGRITSGSDSDAATTGVIWFSLWYWALKNAVAAGTYGGYASMLVTWNLAMAVVSARRNGGIWNSITSADGKLLDEVLPVDYEVSTRNIVGMQAWAWGIGGLFFPAKVFGLFGVVTNPLISALGVGNAITNLVLGGKIMGGTDDDAAANGVTFFGSWGILTTLGIGAGIFTGQYVSLIAMWNLAMALYCATKLL